MREYIVEYLGTVFFLYVIVVTKNPLAIGAALAMALYVAKSLAAGGFNPAATLMSALVGELPMKTLLPYVVAQLAAAVTVQQLYIRMRK